MKRYQRDIVICLIIALATIGVVFHFLQSMHAGQTDTQTDPYAVLDERPDGLLVIRRPAVFARLMLSDKAHRSAMRRFIPEFFLALLDHTDLPTSYLSFHPQGILFYTTLDEQEALYLEKRVVHPLLGVDYPPQRIERDSIRFHYYLTRQGDYIGCYQKDHLWIASTSKHLLEQTARRQRAAETPALSAFQQALMSLDKHALAHVLLPTDSLHISLMRPDSTWWHLPVPWITADLYTEENQLCCIGSTVYQPELDSLYQPLVDTLAARLQPYFPQRRFQTHIDPGEKQLYWTICSQ
ncbi:MAG: hypothetical protein ACI30I_02100 [Parabacteroides sp.]